MTTDNKIPKGLEHRREVQPGVEGGHIFHEGEERSEIWKQVQIQVRRFYVERRKQRHGKFQVLVTYYLCGIGDKAIAYCMCGVERKCVVVRLNRSIIKLQTVAVGNWSCSSLETCQRL